MLTSRGGFSLSEKNSEKRHCAACSVWGVLEPSRIISSATPYLICALEFFVFSASSRQHGKSKTIMGGTQFSSYESKQAGSRLLLLSAFCILISSDTSSNDPPGLWCYWQIRAATWKGLRAWPVAMASSSCWHSVPQKLKDVERLRCPVALQWGASSPAPPWPDPMSWAPMSCAHSSTWLGWPCNAWLSPHRVAVCCLPPVKASAKVRLAPPARFHAGSCISQCRGAAFLSHTAPQTRCNVVKGG